MPLYEYRCSECDATYQKLERVSARSTGTCPQCGGKAIRLIGVPALQFKGSGWYVTDYGSGTNGAGQEAPGTSSDSKTSDAKESTSSGDDSKAKTTKPAAASGDKVA